MSKLSYKYDLELGINRYIASTIKPKYNYDNINFQPTIIKRMVKNNYNLVPKWDEECDTSVRYLED